MRNGSEIQAKKPSGSERNIAYKNVPISLNSKKSDPSGLGRTFEGNSRDQIGKLTEMQQAEGET